MARNRGWWITWHFPTDSIHALGSARNRSAATPACASFEQRFHDLGEGINACNVGRTARIALADGHFRDIDEWVIKRRDFGNGHKEAMLYRRHVDGWKAFEQLMCGHTRAKAGAGLDREESIKKSAARAKAQCRLVCKTMLVNSLWTLTYKANVTDRDLVLRHLKEFIRRVKRVIPDFRYVWTLEHQKRGAYHVHMGTHSLPRVFLRGGVPVKSWDLMRRIWRSITGELEGNFDEAKNRREWHRKGSMQRSAAAIELTLAAVGDRITSTWWDQGRQCFFIETDDTGRPPDVVE